MKALITGAGSREGIGFACALALGGQELAEPRPVDAHFSAAGHAIR